MESTQRTRPCAWCGRPTEDVWCSHPCEIADLEIADLNTATRCCPTEDQSTAIKHTYRSLKDAIERLRATFPMECDEVEDEEQREPIPALYLDSTRRAIGRMGSHPQW